MSTPVKGLFVVLTVFGFLGVVLAYNGIARMRLEAVPPFSEGLYTAVWSVPPPPESIITWCNGIPGRIIVWGSVVFVPVSSYMLFRRGLVLLSILLVMLWSAVCGGLGIWTWIFSLFAS
jgi:hypothetical protein